MQKRQTCETTNTCDYHSGSCPWKLASEMLLAIQDLAKAIPIISDNRLPLLTENNFQPKYSSEKSHVYTVTLWLFVNIKNKHWGRTFLMLLSYLPSCSLYDFYVFKIWLFVTYIPWISVSNKFGNLAKFDVLENIFLVKIVNGFYPPTIFTKRLCHKYLVEALIQLNWYQKTVHLLPKHWAHRKKPC